MPESPGINYRKLLREIAVYQHPSRWQGIWQLVNTLVPYFVLWYVTYRVLDYSTWLAIPLIALLAGFLVRIFIIFHDCGHRSFFRSRKANTFWGILTGMLTFTPFHRWRDSHARHHGTSGNLDKRGEGDVWMMTLTEYLEAPRKVKLKYRFYRNPLVMFLLGPLAITLISNRLVGKKPSRSDRFSVYGTNAVLAGLIIGMVFLLGWEAFLIIQLLSLFLAHIAGVWLFYVQHQFEGVYWKRNAEWNFVTASLEGGSYYRLPGILRWFSGNIGYHHLHHLNAGIPNYRLARCEGNTPDLQQSPSIDVWSSLKSLNYRLWDEDAERLISFKEMRGQQTA